MPKDKNNNQAMTEDEKFRSFFSTTAVNIPEEMTRRDEELPEEKPQKRFGLFARGKANQEEAPAAEPQEMPTGEVVLGGDAQPEQEADLELMLKPAADPEQELAPWPLLETEAEDAEPLRVDLPAPAPAKKPEPPRQSTAPVAEPAGQRSAAKTSRNPTAPRGPAAFLRPLHGQRNRSPAFCVPVSFFPSAAGRHPLQSTRRQP